MDNGIIAVLFAERVQGWELPVCTLRRGVLHKYSGPASKIGGDGIDERGQKKSPSQW